MTGWPEARLLPDKTSASVRTFLEEDVIARYGSTIEMIQSDNGTENAGETAWLIYHLGYKHIFTTPYNPEGNGFVERGHAPLVEGLLKASYDDRSRTASYLPSILWADRITTRRSTGYSPYELVYGMDPLLPMDVDLKTFVAYEWNAIRSTADLLATRTRQLKRRTDDLEKAQIRLQQARALGRSYADHKEGHQLRGPLAVGQLVLVWNPTHAHRAQDRWMGPYRITRQRKGGSYYLQELDGTPLSRAYAAKHVKTYHHRAAEDQEEPEQGTTRQPQTQEASQQAGSSTTTQGREPAPYPSVPHLIRQPLQERELRGAAADNQQRRATTSTPYRLPRARMSRPALPHRDMAPSARITPEESEFIQQHFGFRPRPLTGALAESISHSQDVVRARQEERPDPPLPAFMDETRAHLPPDMQPNQPLAWSQDPTLSRDPYGGQLRNDYPSVLLPPPMNYPQASFGRFR
ncbi:hypothetical protein CF326_g9521 [Tilletia indica]|nr:hypothetical protein CF326_g9521 [Tilletia indica]